VRLLDVGPQSQHIQTPFPNSPFRRTAVEPVIERSVHTLTPAVVLPPPPRPHSLPDPPLALRNTSTKQGPIAGLAAAVVPVVPEEKAAEIEIFEEIECANGKKARRTRKLTYWIFVERHEDGVHAYCKLGCIDDDGVNKRMFSAPNSSAVIRHCRTFHKAMCTRFEECCATGGNIKKLLASIDKIDFDTQEKLTKRRKRSQSLFAKSLKMEAAVASDLRLLMWAVKNGISRHALNDELFDDYIRSLGSITPANRHDLQDQHLPVLDLLVRQSMAANLKGAHCVSLSSDGWRDSARRDWINLVVVWISNAPTESPMWQINCVEPDLIHVPINATAMNISYLINESLEPLVLILGFLHFYLLMAS